MRHTRNAILMYGVAMLFVASVSAFAQTTNIAVFDGQNNDFLLPSYFDTPLPPPQEQTQVAQDTPTDVDILKEIFGNQPQPTVETPKHRLGQTFYPSTSKAAKTFYPTPKAIQEAKKEPLLTPLPPLPEKSEETVAPPQNFQHKSIYAAKLLAKETGKSKANIQLPRDVRLQFNPDAVQLTETVIKWVVSYALHVRKDPRLLFTIRISDKDWSIQQARLSLIIKIAMEQGLPARQIQVFHSARNPDAVIIGAEPHPEQTQIALPVESKKVVREQKTLLW